MKRNFDGVWIPRGIWLSKELTLQEKVFIVEIDSLDNEDGCFASNEYFAKFFQLGKTRVSLIISSLKDKGYLIEAAFTGRSRILKSKLKEKLAFQECERQGFTNVKGSDLHSCKHNSKENNLINKENLSFKNPMFQLSDEVNSENPLKKEKEKKPLADLKKEKEEKFEKFRKRFPGNKGGNQIELENFKKHKDWMDVADIIEEKLEYEGYYREWLKSKKEWVQNWKNLKTWLSNRCWEQEFTEYDNRNQESIIPKHHYDKKKDPVNKTAIPS